MRYLISLWSIVAALIFAGCGSGNINTDGPEPRSEITFNQLASNTNGSHMTMTVEVTSQQSSGIEVVLENMGLAGKYETRALQDLQIYNIRITPSVIEFKESGKKQVEIEFDYAPTNVNIKDISVYYTKIVRSEYTDSKIVKEETKSINTIVPEEENGSNNKFIELIVQTMKTQLTGGESTSIVVQVNDINASPKKPAAFHSLAIVPIEPSDGLVDSYQKTTDNNGRAIFNYTAPETVSTDKSVKLTLYSEVYKDVQVNIEITLKGAVSSQYLLKATDSLTIKNPSETGVIQVQLVKNENGIDIPAFGETVVADVLPLQYGSLSSYEATVGQGGIATFTYTAPSRFPDVNETNIVFHYKKNTSIQDETTLTFSQDVKNVDRLYVLPEKITVTENNQIVQVSLVSVNKDNVGVSTDVRIENPAIDGVDYGSFDKSIVRTDANGRAVVTYMAPGDIANLLERNITITEISQNIQKTLTLQFKDTLDENGTNYDISVVTPSKLSVDDHGIITVKINQLGKDNILIDPTQVLEVNVTSKFSNSLTFEGGQEKTSYKGFAETDINIYSKQIAGVAIIQIDALINDGEKEVLLTKEIPVTILSGPVKAVSLFYNGTTTTDNGLHINKYTLHAVDKYSNPAKEGLKVSPTLINGVKIYPRTSGVIQTNNSTTQFEDSAIDFTAQNLDVGNDRLIVLPDTIKIMPEYLGGWTIKEILSANQLGLEEQYDGNREDGLRYIIGSETRLMIDGNPALAHIVDPTGRYVVDKDGTMQLEVRYDPVLSGHTVALGVYVSDVKRMGVAKVVGLRWGDYTSSEVIIDNDGNTHDVTLQLGIGGNSPQHLMDVDINPESIIIDPLKGCELDSGASDFHTDRNGRILVVINTDGNTTNAKQCTIRWNATNNSIYLEY